MWPLLAGLLAALVLLLWISPDERTLGQAVKLVYLHGALVRTATVLLVVSLPVNLVALVWGWRAWLAWGKALAWTAVGIWIAHALFSMITTYATWGVFIAWFEPRTRFTFALSMAGLVVLIATHLMDHPRLGALAYALLAGLTLFLAPRLGAIQHPLEAIRASPSDAIRAFYAAILAVTLAMGALVVVWLQPRLTPDP